MARTAQGTRRARGSSNRCCERQHVGCGPALGWRKMTVSRPSNRAADELRPVTFTRRFTKHAGGSVLVQFGDTHVLCTASVEETVPSFLRGKGQGWVTAEYGMLQGSTHTPSPTEAPKGRQHAPSQNTA